MTAFANPLNPTVIQGSASFAANGSALTVTNSANAIINWQAFSIGKGELTRFVQPSAASAVLNRITGQDPSQILGQLQSNGRVLLINPNGILFGKDARVDVAGLVASTLNLSNDDFLAGRYRFTGNGINGVVNQGAISTPMGGSVYLIGGSTRNEGLITSPKGEVILAAGQTVNLVDTATPNVKVEIVAPAGEAVNLGSIFAGGGSIDIHAATVNQQGIVNADALARDDQGHIRLIASGNMTLGAGSVTSAANNAGGDGGFVETSGAHVKIEDGARISTAAPQGKPGTWLIDPVDFTIAASGGDMTGATLSTNLGAGNVSILSSSGIAGVNGDVNVNDPVTWVTGNSLSLSAFRHININQPVSAGGAVTLFADNTGTGVGTVNFGGSGSLTSPGTTIYYNPPSFGAPTSFSANITGGPITQWWLVSSVAHLQAMSVNATSLSGNYLMMRDIDASASPGFTPIGWTAPFTIAPFRGIFDGGNHVVANLTINLPTESNVGLFGILRGMVKNVGVLGGSVTGSSNVGGLVGSMQNFSLAGGSTLDHVFSTANVAGGQRVGGLVGQATPSSGVENNILTSYSGGNVTAGNVARDVGGLVGLLDGTFLTNSYATGSVTAGTNSIGVGGLVGRWVKNGFAQIINTYSAGSVTAGAGSTDVGGHIGLCATGASNTVPQTCSSGSVVRSFWDVTTSGQATTALNSASSSSATGMITADMQTQANFTSATVANGNVNPNWNFASTWFIPSGGGYPLGFRMDVAAANATMPAGGPLPLFSVACNGVANCSGISGLSGVPSFGTTATLVSPAGAYPITVSGLTSNFFNLNPVPGTLTVTGTLPTPPPPPPPAAPPPPPAAAPPASAPATSSSASTASSAASTLDRLPDLVVQSLNQATNDASVTSGGPLALSTDNAADRSTVVEPVLDILGSCGR